MKIHLRVIITFIIIFLLNSCATYKPQYKDSYRISNIPSDAIAHSFYLIGDAGNSSLGSESEALNAFKIEISTASNNSTALFLGDNIYPHGMPNKEDKGRTFAEHQLNVQTNVVEDFKGQTIFIPGNHDWYSNGLKGLKRQEKYIEKKLGKNTFLPENGCPLKKVNITDDIVMIIVDSEWYLANWDKHPTINDDCEIKTRDKFFEEFESLIKKARGKTTIIAVHHPMFTNGPHGGQYSLKQQLFPLDNNIPVPVLGSVANFIRKTSGISPADIQNKRYIEFKKRMVALAQENDKAIFVSGHEHTLQYLEQDDLPQIVSGSGSKISATRNVDGGQFSYGASGYARLDVLKNGASYVRFYTAKDHKMVFQKEIYPSDKINFIPEYDTSFPSSKAASIYSEEETTKGSAYKFIWGDRYRKYYNTKVVAPTVALDTLFGGLIPIRKGGGHQSKSLRLEDKDGREYIMRALRKNAVQYMQSVAFKDQYVMGKFEETYTEELLLDVFTGSHPYAPFVVGKLSDAIGILHTNPVLYYVPKQNALGHFNDEFGDELYMIEERAASGHGDNESFGFSNEIISTDDLLENLRKDEDYKLDEASYIRARLFDMLIGDWDRHEDQWRWASFKENGKTIYRPVPRDRDQAFSIMANGALLSFVTTIEPTLRLMKPYKKNLRSPKWFNIETYPLDMTLIVDANKDIWDTQVKLIQENLTNEIIDEAFKYFPKEVNDTAVREIMLKLKGRRKNLQKISDKYFKHINKFDVVIGTDKDDWFEIERLSNGETRVTSYRIKNDKKADVFHQKTYNSNLTKEIWVYGLDDKDTFKVSGEGDHLLKVILIGGQNKDTYIVENGKKVKIYDYKSKESNFITDKGIKKLVDDYETNVFDYKKLKNSTNRIIPMVGINPDDGLKLGILNSFTVNGFERNPFTSQHKLSAAYYFSTEGFAFKYNGEFANIIDKWNLGFETILTSPNYSINFFGFGNETPNFESDDNDGLDVDLDFNRVRIRALKIAPSLILKGELGSNLKVGLSYESIEVEKTPNRFISLFYLLNGESNDKNFIGIETSYSYENIDNIAFPTLGMITSLQLGYKTDTDGFKGFGYIIPTLGFAYKLLASGQLVLATKFKGHVTLGNNFQFYQAPSIGANNGLRGYRNERFAGKNSFYQTTDLRLNLYSLKTQLLPLSLGVYLGVDYGRVWIDDDNSKKWNNSYGIGFFTNAVDIITVNVSAFHSDDGLRFAFKFGFGF